MLMRTATAGMGDTFGASTGHPSDPRTDAEAFEDAWFIYDECKRIVIQMEETIADGNMGRFSLICAELNDLTEPM